MSDTTGAVDGEGGARTGLFAELKRRNVIRIAGVYTVTAWAIFQVVSAVAPALDLPKWTVTFSLVLLALGLPVALIIAWAFERTPEGIRPTAPAEAGATPAGMGRLDWAVLAAAALIVGVAGYQIIGARDGAGGGDRSVAVLPFASFSRSAEDGFFADGLTEELINSLAQLPQLKVTGRTSSFYFKGRNVDLRDVGKKLGVAHVVEGSVRRDGDRLRVTAQLIKTADGFHLWSETYDRPVSDVLKVQTDIANSVANVLKAQLLEPGAAPTTRSGEAVAMELQARARLRTNRLEDVEAARTLFEQLTRLEPRNPDAWAGLSDALMKLAQDHLAIEFDPAVRDARGAVDRALAVDPRSANALRAKAFIHRVLAIRTGNIEHHRIAEQVLRQALAREPRNPDALTLYGTQLASLDRSEEALTMLRRALAIDPLNRAAQTMVGVTLENLGRLDEAERQYQNTAELFPDYTPTLLTLAQLRVARGDLAGAIAPLRRARTIDDDAAAGFMLAHVYINLGMQKEFENALDGIEKSPMAAGLAQAIRLLAARDYRGLMTLSEREFKRTNDPIWRDAISKAAMFTGDFERARTLMAELTPGLFLPEPQPDASAYESMVTAGVMAAVGDQRQARRLLRLVVDGEKPTPGAPEGTLVLARVAAWEGLGDREAALRELTSAIGAGYRTPIDFEIFAPIVDYPLARGLNDDPRFKALMARIASDNAATRAQLEGS